ncbi:TonB-dependent receptor [Thalassotalea fonticola]|uniref:TonB-dependent receptor n=1 Tax=Thalassotalea fonticola TaxID=3065649 RepID=A0ABZ0GQP9_9GAMM|nr:TonB-dependent receptor [Colwelliaceae bacterium S1-1]
MKQLPRKRKIVIACAHAMTLLIAQQAYSAEDAVTEKESNKALTETSAKEGELQSGVEIIEVTGYRSSLEKALDKKREANGVIDSIIAEDIGKMADANAAEAMQRITGVSINRDGGEGTTVSIRGLGPEMNQVSVNGQTIAGGSDGGAVSFDTMSADMLSAIEIVKSPSAHTEEGSLGGKINLKTVRPLDRKNPSFTGQIKQSYNELADENDPTFQLNYINQFMDSTIGVALNATYERRRSRADRAFTYGWEGNQFSHDTSGRAYMKDDNGTLYRQDKNSGQIFDANGDAVEGIDPNSITEQEQLGYLPTFLISEYEEQDRIRKGVSFTLEYKPTDTFHTYLDLSHTQLDTTRDKSMLRHSYKRGANGTFSSDDLGLHTGAEIDPNSETITHLTNMKGSRQLILQKQEELTETSVASLGFDYDIDTWNISGRIGYSLTTQEWPNDNRFNFQTGEMLHGYTLANNPQLPEYIWASKYADGADLIAHPPTHPDNNKAFGDQLIDGNYYFSPASTHNTLGQVWENQRDLDDSTLTAQLDFTYLLDSDHFSAVEFGVKYTDRTTERYQAENLLSLSANLPSMKNTVYLDDGALATDFPVDDFLEGEGRSSGPIQGVVDSWSFGDFNQINKTVLAQYNSSYNESITDLSKMPWQLDLRNSYDVDQQFLAGYIQVNVDTLDGRLVGDFGVRVVQTENDSSGYGGGKVDDVACTYSEDLFELEQCAAQFQRVTAEHEYTEVLPSANFRYALTDNLLTRVTASKAMARPTIFQMAPYVKENVSENAPDNASRRSGNPFLDPMVAWQYDLTMEWYFQKGGILAGGVFYKDIDTFIYNRTDIVDEVMLDADDNAYIGNYGDGENPDFREIRPYKTTRPVNGEGASIVGVEANYQQSFVALPGDWAGLGVAVNYTYADSEATYVGSNDQGEEVEVETAFQGQSKHTYNASVYWEKYGHSIRLSYNYRTESLYQPISSTKDMIWSDDYGQLDFAARYKINKDLNVGFQAVNLTEEVPYRYHTNAWDGNPVDDDVYENRLSSYTVNGRTFRLTLNATF